MTGAWSQRGAIYEMDGPGWQAKAWRWRPGPPGSKTLGRYVVRRMPGAILLQSGELPSIEDAMCAAEQWTREHAQ